MNRLEAIGLWWGAAALVITIAFVGYDISRYVRGLETISENIWAYLRAWQAGGYKFGQFPWEAVILPLGVSQQAIGLLIHLMAGLLRVRGIMP